MDLAVMEGFRELIYSAGSSTPTTTTTTTTCTDDDISWDSNWSPQALYWSHEGLNPFSNNFEIPFSEGSPADPCFASSPSPVFQNCSSDSGLDPAPFPGEDSGKRQRLLHLLMAAAEALSGDLNGRDLARVILVRLKELTTPATEMGIDRLAAHFTDALFSLLDGGDVAASVRCRYPAAEALTASQLFQDMSPFASFGRLTANQAILEAFAGERRVHIVDYDVGDGVQWASLIQAMASRKDGPSAPHLKITAMTSCSRRSASEAHEAGRRLSAFAASVGQPFAFRLCRFDQQKRFQPAAVKVVRGEPVAVNCVLHPAPGSHGDGSAASVFSFLSGAVALGARVVSIVEEEGAEKGGFLERFAVELERYMAVWEALEAEFPNQGRVREMVERVVLGPRIAGAVRKAYGRSDGCGTAAEWMAALGFKRVGLSFANLCQAKLLLGLFSDGYKVDEDGLNKIGLSWKSCRLVSASVWAAQTRRSASP